MSLPNYELAELKKFNINVLAEASDEEAGFVIALATFYNDMKDLFWIFQLLDDKKPDNLDIINTTNGQFNGQVNFILRNLIGIFWEFISLLKKNNKVFEFEAIKYAENRLIGNAKLFWDEMKNLALNDKNNLSPKEQVIVEALVIIRDSISFHYYGTTNHVRGLKDYIEEKKEAAAIYISMGDKLETSRFYFADAATQYRIKTILVGKNLTENEVVDFFKKLNPSVRGLIDSYTDSQDKIKNGNREHKRYFKKLRGLI